MKGVLPLQSLTISMPIDSWMPAEAQLLDSWILSPRSSAELCGLRNDTARSSTQKHGVSLRASMEAGGLSVSRAEKLPGLIPIGYVEGSFEEEASTRSG